MTLSDDEFRDALRDVLARSGRSMRGLSAAMGRDPGYVAALLDPDRPSRARPTPADLLAASDATGLRFVDLLGHMKAFLSIEEQAVPVEVEEGELEAPAAPMFEEDDADLAAVRCAPVELLGDIGQRRPRRPVAAQGDACGDSIVPAHASSHPVGDLNPQPAGCARSR